MPDGSVHKLAANNGPNCLHGGVKNFGRVMWDKAEIIRNIDLPLTIDGTGSRKGSGVKFYRLSDDGEEGFPGKLAVEASYIVTTDKELYFNWKAWLVQG
jgi:aldose 1-epimerase